ncbi:hypothetical protein B0H67DRAFT_551311 [Lasiosphaeris hirsuta]|uniref:Uncharacterized protein n=1 Tax=Lasiosphaeris hirsuta TaxID=260670 RepID=A0AA40B1J1_9PEZI|nr:hypothetical protein B0H67DRAFT_551311 [Lasiosphaeris hirsuta]
MPVLEGPMHMVVHYDTDSIFFYDSVTQVNFYIDGTGIEYEDSQEEEGAKIELSQYYMANHLERNGVSIFMARGQSVGTLLSRINDLHARETSGVEEAMRATSRVVARLISILEQRALARERLKSLKRASGNGYDHNDNGHNHSGNGQHPNSSDHNHSANGQHLNSEASENDRYRSDLI